MNVYLSGSEVEVAELPRPENDGLGGVGPGGQAVQLERGLPGHKLEVVVSK